MKKTALITGASTGIGRAAATALAAQGWQVLAGARKAEDLQALNDIKGVEGIRLDITNEHDIESLKAKIASDYANRLDALVNNAGIAVGGAWEMVEAKELRQQFEVNVFGLVHVLQAMLPSLREAKGRVVNISSISGRVAGAFLGPYAASKFAVEAITDSLRREMQPFGVQVSSINPGPIKTPIWEKGALAATAIAADNPHPAAPHYQKAMTSFQDNISRAAKNAGDVSLVTNALIDALEARKPRTRYFIGKGIWFAAQLAHLPDRLLDTIIGRAQS